VSEANEKPNEKKKDDTRRMTPSFIEQIAKKTEDVEVSSFIEEHCFPPGKKQYDESKEFSTVEPPPGFYGQKRVEVRWWALIGMISLVVYFASSKSVPMEKFSDLSKLVLSAVLISVFIKKL